MHPVVHPGRYWKIRRAIAYALVAVYFALPLIPIGGFPAVLIDIANRRSHLFGTTFYPTDTILAVAFGFGIIVLVFFVGLVVRADVVRLRLPADGVARVPLSPRRGVPGGRAR